MNYADEPLSESDLEGGFYEIKTYCSRCGINAESMRLFFLSGSVFVDRRTVVFCMNIL